MTVLREHFTSQGKPKKRFRVSVGLSIGDTDVMADFEPPFALCGLVGCGRPAVNDYDLQGFCNGLHQALQAERESIGGWLMNSPGSAVAGASDEMLIELGRRVLAGKHAARH